MEERRRRTARFGALLASAGAVAALASAAASASEVITPHPVKPTSVPTHVVQPAPATPTPAPALGDGLTPGATEGQSSDSEDDLFEPRTRLEDGAAVWVRKGAVPPPSGDTSLLHAFGVALDPKTYESYAVPDFGDGFAGTAVGFIAGLFASGPHTHPASPPNSAGEPSGGFIGAVTSAIDGLVYPASAADGSANPCHKLNAVGAENSIADGHGNATGCD